MTAPAIANARQSVAAPARTARRFGLFSVVSPIDTTETHWMMGGLTADAEECSMPLSGELLCGPTPPKTARSWYSDATGNPWLSYMYETCKTVGRVNEAQARLRARFLASEQSSAEAGLQSSLLTVSNTVGGTQDTVAEAIGVLEADAAANYGGQIILHLGFKTAAEAARQNLLARYGDHLETLTGSLVVVGNYDPTMDGGNQDAPVIYATGAIDLYRSPLTEVPPYVNRDSNDYFTLIERAYSAVADCYVARNNATLCGCGGAATVPEGPVGAVTLNEGSVMSAVALGVLCAETNAEMASRLNIRGVTPNPTTDWGVGNCASIDCAGDVDREVRWTGNAWVGC